MPVVSMFYGDIVSLYFMDNRQQRCRMFTFAIRMMRRFTRFPRASCWLARCRQPRPSWCKRGWMEIHRDELVADWQLAAAGQQPFKIEPLR
jgi:hypothetical protein